MPDVMLEAARTSYDDAYEVIDQDGGDVVVVATFSVDRLYDGTPTGDVDPLPIRVIAWNPEDDTHQEAYLGLEAARELLLALDAAIAQVEWTRHRRRVEA